MQGRAAALRFVEVGENIAVLHHTDLDCFVFFLITEIVCRVNTLCRKFLELNYLVIK